MSFCLSGVKMQLSLQELFSMGQRNDLTSMQCLVDGGGNVMKRSWHVAGNGFSDVTGPRISKQLLWQRTTSDDPITK